MSRARSERQTSEYEARSASLSADVVVKFYCGRQHDMHGTLLQPHQWHPGLIHQVHFTGLDSRNP